MGDDDMDAGQLDADADGADFDAARHRASGVRVFTLFRKRQFDYSFLPAAGQTTITIRRALRVPPFYYHWVALRIHNANVAGGTFRLVLYQTLPSDQDPQEFTSASGSFTLACGSSDTPPAIKTARGNDLGPYFRVILNATQGSTAGAPFYAEMSAVLYSRPA